MPHRPVSIKASALRWLAQREHSPQELRDKLLRLRARKPPVCGDALDDPSDPVDAVDLDHPDHPDPPDPPNDPHRSGRVAAGDLPANPEAEVDALLQWLAAQGHLSSERFVASRVRTRQAHFGNLRIRQELQQHGLQLDGATRQALQANEAQRALAVWQRKYGQVASGAPQRMQQLRFLAGRGFSMDVVRRVVLGAARSTGNDDDPGDPEDSSP